MSRARFKKGGSVEKDPKGKEISLPAVSDAYAGGNSEVAKLAKERKHGGKVEKEEKKEKHHVEGKKPKMHFGRPGRKSGGRVGAEKSPLSGAARISSNDERP